MRTRWRRITRQIGYVTSSTGAFISCCIMRGGWLAYSCGGFQAVASLCVKSMGKNIWCDGWGLRTSRIKPSIETIARSHHQCSIFCEISKTYLPSDILPWFAKIHHHFLEPQPTLRGFTTQVWPATVIPFSSNPWLTKYSHPKLGIGIRNLLLAAPLKSHFKFNKRYQRPPSSLTTKSPAKTTRAHLPTRSSTPQIKRTCVYPRSVDALISWHISEFWYSEFSTATTRPNRYTLWSFSKSRQGQSSQSW